MSEDNKAAARRFLECFSSGDLDGLDEIMAEDYVDHDPYNPHGQEGLEGVKKLISMYREGFPDLTFEIEDVLAEGDKVVVRWTGTGTHQGEVMGVPGSGKTSTVSGISIDRFENGKAVEGWTCWDTLGMLQQIGAIPEPQAAGAS